MKVSIQTTKTQAEIHLEPETTQERDVLMAASGAATEAKVKRNGGVTFVLDIPETPIGRVTRETND